MPSVANSPRKAIGRFIYDPLGRLKKWQLNTSRNEGLPRIVFISDWQEMRKDSLDAIPTRLATEGQKLVTHTFPDGVTGFMSPGDAHQDCLSRHILPQKAPK
jgi:hypothetical protein